METQTFRAPSMLEALQNVQKELGPDAIVVSMREMESSAGWPLKRKPCCEIIAARPIKPAVLPAAMVAPQPPKAARSHAVPDAAIQALAQLASGAAPAAAAAAPTPPPKIERALRPFKPEVLSTRSTTMTWIASDEMAIEQKAAPAPLVSAPVAPAPTLPKALEPLEAEEPEAAHPLARICGHLLNQGLHAGLVKRLERICEESLSPNRLADAGYLASFLKKQLAAALHKSELKLEEGRHVVCIIGPSGAGKTSACAKLAAHYTLGEGKRVVWIEANTVRTGAISEARMITESLGVPLFLAYTPQDLVDALAQSSEADLVLVDSASCNPRLEANLVNLADMLTPIAGRTTFLVTPATTKESDLNHALAAFSPFQLDGFVVTKMDEATTTGSIFNLTWHSKIPVIYVSSSPMVMDELERVDSQWVVNSLFSEV